MAQTEITVQVFEDFESIKNKLKKCGFLPAETFVLDDEYYSKYSLAKIMSLDYAALIKSSILLRQITDAKTQTQLIYKTKTIDKNGVVEAEEKHKMKIESKTAAQNILSKAGLVCYSKLLQKCHVFKGQNYSFVVQTVDNLGTFIEFEESEQMANLSAVEKIAQLTRLAQSFNLKLGKDYSCKKPYMMLHKSK